MAAFPDPLSVRMSGWNGWRRGALGSVNQSIGGRILRMCVCASPNLERGDDIDRSKGASMCVPNQQFGFGAPSQKNAPAALLPVPIEMPPLLEMVLWEAWCLGAIEG